MPEGSAPVAFGASGGLRRDDNTSCLAGIVANGTKDTSEKCLLGCLFNISTDPGETHNLIATHRDVAATLSARLKKIGDEAPPPSSYWADPTAQLASICKTQDATGWLEPLGWKAGRGGAGGA
jgi:hypothetical protein